MNKISFLINRLTWPLILLGSLLVQSPTHAAEIKLIKVVATTGQIADAVAHIGGSLVEVQALMGPGVDPHLYQASQGDVLKLATAEIIFYNGLHLEAKMGEIFEKMGRKIKTVGLGDHLPTEKLLSSDTFSNQHDPHIWFDVPLWSQAVEKINTSLQTVDPKNKEIYESNFQKYREKLTKLHAFCEAKISEVPESQRVLVTAHDAFRYFGRAYGFQVLGLQGISTESEAGTADVKNLADFIAQQKIKAIFVESSVPTRNIQAVQEAVKSRGWEVKIGGELFSDALGAQGTEEGTYIGMVTHNVTTITNALK